MLCKQPYLLLTLLVVLSQCIEPIEFSNPGEEPPIVVSGLITNLEESHEVKVLQSVSFTDESFKTLNFRPINDARVFIEDGTGNIEMLTLDDPRTGSYLTRDDFYGIVGKRYRTRIILSNEEEIISDFELLKPVSKLEEMIAFESEKELLKDNQVIKKYGLQISARLKDPMEKMDYYRWRWSGTFEIIRNADPNPCWVTESDQDGIVILSDVDQNGDEIVIPIAFIEYFKRIGMNDRYVVTLEQQSLSKAAYNYLSKIKNQRERQGSIFDPTPAPIPGNLKYKNRSGKIVLGFFGASAVSRLRRDQLLINLNSNKESACLFNKPPCNDCSFVRNASRIKPDWY